MLFPACRRFPAQKESINLRLSHTRSKVLALSLLLLLAGCGRHTPTNQAPANPQVDPEGPVAAGHEALPLPGEASPLMDRPLKGLYAVEPTPDTLQNLAVASVSPDGFFRALVVEGSIWVARVDGAWIWQAELPPMSTGPAGATGGQSPAGGAANPSGTASTPGQPGMGTTPGQPGTAAAPGTAGALGEPGSTPPAAPISVVGPFQWSARSTLVFRDSLGRWLEANPATALVTPLSPTFQGVTSLVVSPDGRQVLYHKGIQLFTALFDGSQARLIGENLTGHWDATGQLVTTKTGEPGAGSAQVPGATGRGAE